MRGATNENISEDEQSHYNADQRIKVMEKGIKVSSPRTTSRKRQYDNSNSKKTDKSPSQF